MPKTNSMDMKALLAQEINEIDRKKSLKDAFSSSFTTFTNTIGLINDELVELRYENVVSKAKARQLALEALDA